MSAGLIRVGVVTTVFFLDCVPAVIASWILFLIQSFLMMIITWISLRFFLMMIRTIVLIMNIEFELWILDFGFEF
jgi:hypothetical protein